MPKKHHQAFTKSGSSYVHPSHLAPRPSSAASSSESVNERIERLRREQAPKASVQRQSELIADLTTRTVPPQLRSILNIPETAPPRPRPGIRPPRRRVPGPSAPPSWSMSGLESSKHAVRSAPSPDTEDKRWRPRTFDDLRLSQHFRGKEDVPRSLVHQVLRTFAMNWNWLVGYERNNLATVPTSMKALLLEYISMYGPEEGITLNELKILFLNEMELHEATGSEELTMLDLSGLIGVNISLNELKKYFVIRSVVPKQDSQGNVATESQLKHNRRVFGEKPILDSWEDEVHSLIPLAATLHPPRFPNLTHLSLAHPGPSVSWASLLALSTHLATVTHLSLAYWPAPCMTPNSKTTTVISPHSRPVNLGGTHFYSIMDDDWNEAANVLRRFSKNTYSLQWLDLEGCGEWLPALTWGQDSSSADSSSTASRRPNPEDWVGPEGQPGPNWNGSWRQVAYINVSQGWIPKDTTSIRMLPASQIAWQLLEYHRHRDEANDSHLLDEDASDDQAKATHAWFEKEKTARKVEQTLREIRSSAKGIFCKFDYGWEPVTTTAVPSPFIG
ncbi:hypothetical protein M501DRAFT_966661 [Patellaria atrata CBS 101060]|uniref:Tafazzin n=1 Tax=Patellaria atrata CBS 101060 TaxID=1346257 RepID=A0A9P4SIV5_9PEZI|nr:hypothetical protein M501DRAFT_966661 [Patellaria atrata CBS 101060]